MQYHGLSRRFWLWIGLLTLRVKLFNATCVCLVKPFHPCEQLREAMRVSKSHPCIPLRFYHLCSFWDFWYQGDGLGCRLLRVTRIWLVSQNKPKRPARSRDCCIGMKPCKWIVYENPDTQTAAVKDLCNRDVSMCSCCTTDYSYVSPLSLPFKAFLWI